ncbi:hypothetical protein Tco_1173325 [Tanacetum coccineum]
MTSSSNYSIIEDATAGLNEAIQSGNKDDIEKFSKRTVKEANKRNNNWMPPPWAITALVPKLDGNVGTSPIQLDIEQKTALSSDACEILVFREKDNRPSLGKRLRSDKRDHSSSNDKNVSDNVNLYIYCICFKFDL